MTIDELIEKYDKSRKELKSSIEYAENMSDKRRQRYENY